MNVPQKNTEVNPVPNDARPSGDAPGIGELTRERPSSSTAIQVPEISLPKGGGALKSIDEKFEVNAANGTASFRLPFPLTPGRHGFAPSLALTYNSGGGNSPCGLGWSVDYPAIRRRTEKRLPRYRDGAEEDIFQFSGAEDLTPYLDRDGAAWTLRERTVGDLTIRRYRPRIEGGFSRIERISGPAPAQVYWKVTTRDNVTTFFGLSPAARLADPEDATRIYAWLPEFSCDDRGNWLRYTYKAEDLADVPDELHERNRHRGLATFTNRYLKRVRYGNRQPWYPDDPFLPNLPPADAACSFEVVLDYGEHTDPEADTPAPPAYEEVRSWPARPDAFSSYRSGFEIRTYRRCFHILMFHHFQDEQQFAGTPDAEAFGNQYLVKALALEYRPSSINASGQTEVSYLRSITQKGFIRRGGAYSEKSLPPLTFDYQTLQWNTTVRTVDRDNIVHAPAGLTTGYQWVDLYGEGISGILSEQAEGWYYKSNLGDVDQDHQVRFSRAGQVLSRPSLSGLAAGLLTIEDLDGDGRKQAVVRSPGLQGYFELDTGNRYQPFRAFDSVLNVDLHDPNTRLLDVNGDGRAELVITEDNVFTWYPGKGKKGYEPARQSLKPFDEERGPALVFADTDRGESIFLADMTGDGLTDIVRVRNGEICYWANRGYGRFSARVNMSGAPLFDRPGQFNPRYVQMADVSGTGASDILYLGKNTFKACLNLSGNAWSEVREIEPFFPIDANTRLSVVDLLGTGTSCIVWSSDLPSAARHPMRYIDLMDSRKPHVLRRYVNNFGKETTLEYKSSTHFYLKDKLEGRPWITKLPFPVQVVARSVVEDQITRVRFSAEYRYHHGYYDHAEQEFRGFGLVEQIDTEHYESWQANNAGTLLEQSEALYQPPTLTKTWYHTGAFTDHRRILSRFQQEYWYEAYNRGFPDAPLTMNEPALEDARIVLNATLEGRFDPGALSGEEMREALRACKGMMLRREVFALDAPSADASPEARRQQAKPFVVSTHNCLIQLLQARDRGGYASFLVTESEALTIHYERDEADPRLAHTLNTRIDELGNILETASVVYPRQNPQPVNDLVSQAALLTYQRPEEKQACIDSLNFLREEQGKTMIIYTRNRFTNDVVQDDAYRLRRTAETETYEITALPKAGPLYHIADFEDILTTGSSVRAYREAPSAALTQRRLIEHLRSLYYNENLTAALPLGQVAGHGMAFESYQLVYTPALLTDLFGARIADPGTLLGGDGHFVHSGGDANWWIRSGRSHYVRTSLGETLATARSRFLAPVLYESATGAETRVFYYGNYFLLLEAIEDAAGNRMTVERYNFRTLSPMHMRDQNDNISGVLLDELGLVKAMAVMGKGAEADQLTGLTEFTLQPERDAVQQYFTLTDTAALRAAARDLLQGATNRFVYDFDRYHTSAQLREQQLAADPGASGCALIPCQPTAVGGIAREQHHQLDSGSPLQLRFEYSDGMGRIAMTKIQAEPGPALALSLQPDCAYTLHTIDTGAGLRWIGNGRTVLNNKGNPVKQYEPYFSAQPGYEDHRELVERGVTPIVYYDALGRRIRTDLPDGAFTQVTFDSWQQARYDQNDTAARSRWYDERINRLIDDELTAAGMDPAKEAAAAEQTARHQATPMRLHLDTLGRPVLRLAHNRVEETDALGNVIAIRDEWHPTTITLDVEGNTQAVTDARGNAVMAYAYDMLGHRVRQTSADAGGKWTLNNAAGRTIRSWDSRGHTFSSTYDVLQRPLERRLQREGLAGVFLIERITYGEGQPGAAADNLRGQVYRHDDSGGSLTNVRYDFKGNLLEAQRQLAAAYDAEIIDWSAGLPAGGLDAETFTALTEYDALNRMRRLYNWHRSADRLAVYEPAYNERGLVAAGVHVTGARRTAGGYTGGRVINAVSEVRYDEKGQRTHIRYANGTRTRYHYDRQTFRLIQLRTTRNAADAALPAAPSSLTNPNVLQNLYYTYDAVGNILEIEDDAYEPVFFNNQAVQPRSRYTYDALYRLLRAEGRENLAFDQAPGPLEPALHAGNFPRTDQALRNYTQTYGYDAGGNILRMRHQAGAERWTRHYEYAAGNNRLARTWQGADELNAVVYQYDDHGNMLNYHNSPAEFQPQWDYRDMVHRLHLGGGGDAFYQYSGASERSRKRVERAGGISEERLYLGGMEVYRRRRGAAVVEEIETHHLFVDDQRVLLVEHVLQTDNNSLSAGILDRFQYGNHLKSVGLELDGNGAILSYEEYHPYGTVAYRATNAAVTTTAKRYRYTGMERDEESGLNYHSARYYMPWLGRWLSPDPLGLADGANLYRYGRNNVLKYEDPRGTDPPEGGSREEEEPPVQVTPLLTQVSPLGVAGNVQFYNLFSSDRSASGRLSLSTGLRSSFLLEAPALDFSTTGFATGTAEATVDTEAGSADVRLEGGLVLGQAGSGLNLVTVAEGSLRVPVPERLVLNQLSDTFLSGLPSATGDLSLHGALRAGTFTLGTFRGSAHLEGGAFEAQLRARAFADLARVDLEARGRVGAGGEVSLTSVSGTAEAGVPGLRLDARFSGAPAPGGGLAVRGSAQLHLLGIPSVSTTGTGLISGDETYFQGAFSGYIFPLTYTSGDYLLSTTRGVSLSAGAIGLTYTPEIDIADPSPLPAGFRAHFSVPDPPSAPHGLTLGASYTRLHRGGFTHLSVGAMTSDFSSIGFGAFARVAF